MPSPAKPNVSFAKGGPDWSPEPELLQECPRPVSWTRSARFARVAFLLLIAGACYVSVFHYRRAVRQSRLVEEGVPVSGEISRIEKIEAGRVFFDFEYTVAGHRYEGDGWTPDDVRFESVGDDPATRVLVPVRVSAGDAVELMYLPAEPSVHAMTDEIGAKADNAWHLFWGGTVLWGGGLTVGFACCERQWRRLRSLARSAVVAPALITRSRRNAAGVCIVEYEFLTDAGETLRGKSGMPGAITGGSALTVLYDPQRPSRHALYEIVRRTVLVASPRPTLGGAPSGV